MPDLRLMQEHDIDAAHELVITTFEDLERRLGAKYAGPQPQLPQSRIRFRRILRTDPEGSWLGVSDGRVVGLASSILREGVWGLSMFVVAPGQQGTGVGRALLQCAAAYGDGARGRIILASRDARAIAMYARLGLHMEPSVSGQGLPRAVDAAGVRPGGPDDLPLTAAVDRAVRGAAHGDDILAMLAGGAELLVAPDRGYAVLMGGTVRMLGAFDEAGAATVLRGALARIAALGLEANVEWITARQAWAVPVCLAAGLTFSTLAGPVFTGGDVGPFKPYLPSGAYL